MVVAMAGYGDTAAFAGDRLGSFEAEAAGAAGNQASLVFETVGE